MSNPFNISGTTLAVLDLAIAGSVFHDNGTTVATFGQTAQLMQDLVGGNNASQGTTSNQPTYVLDTTYNLPALRFQPLTASGNNYVWNPNQSLNNTTLSFNRNSIAGFIVCRGVHGNQQTAFGSNSGGGALVTMASPVAAGCPAIYSSLGMPNGQGHPGGVNLLIGGNTYTTAQPDAIGETINLIAFNSNGSNTQLYINGQTNTSAGVSSTAYTGFQLGNLTNGFPFDGYIYYVVFTTGLTATDFTSVITQLNTRFNIPTYTSQVILAVESNSYGVCGQQSSGTTNVFGTGIGSYLIPLLPRTTKVVNCGVAGLSLQTARANLTNYTALINPNWSGNVIALHGGLNDATGGRSPAQIEADMQYIGQNARLAGAHVVMWDEVSATTSSGFTSGAVANNSSGITWAAINWPQFADARGPMPAQLADTSNTANYDSIDHVHLTPTAKQLVAQLLSARISQLGVITGTAGIAQLPDQIVAGATGQILLSGTPLTRVVASPTGTTTIAV